MHGDGSISSTPDGGGPEREVFDTGMLIILAVLLFALLFALGLNLLVRCGLQQLIISAQQSGASMGLKKRMLSRIPVAVYRSPDGISTSSECPICLGEFIDGERLRVLPKCSHGFHVGCIDTWLLSHPSCPSCRASLQEVELP
ncbi:RING/U-box superfamily protein [Dorcoceras hygrometricum]|uniref:RING-type E3 ubiquitin transferase n=1 Tax=Dorcoceras hygrometricum TaxID=472368 RepID=A0A2Z7C2G8_9LAMI|nr:RING/U-box superfamily protein [Dorcoceras hygrometricum]